jgi:hypothetical protein
MLEFLKGRATERKLRLFAVACVRRAWHLLTDPRSRAAVEIAERFADGLTTEERREAADFAGMEANNAWVGRPNNAGTLPASAAAAGTCAADAGVAAEVAYGDVLFAIGDPERAIQAALLRDILGPPPFRAVPRGAWLTPQAVELAQTMYDSRDFARMPDLAGLLEAAGCRDAEVLGHCRGQGPHVRGCWVVDLVLAKS